MFRDIGHMDRYDGRKVTFHSTVFADHGRIITIEVNERNAVIEDADMMREIGEFFLKAAADRERGS